MSDKFSAYYFPAINRKVYNIACVQIKNGTCDVFSIADEILKEVTLDRDTLIRRIRRALMTLSITGDIELLQVESKKRTPKMIVKKVNQ